MEAILNNDIEHCQEQEDMINNIVLPVLEREDVVFKEDEVEKGLGLIKYFDFKLCEWEVFLFACIVGIQYTDGSDVYFNEIDIYVGRGSGKNGFISFLSFYFLSPHHGIKGYNIDILANSEDQAKTSFNDVYEIIKEPPKEYTKAIKSNYYATKEDIMGKVTKSHLRYNTSSTKTKDSKRTGCVIIDEKHAYQIKDTKNIDTLTSGLGKVPFGRVITISTDGHVRGGALDQDKEINKEKLSKYDPDNRKLIFWCRIEKEEEYKDPNKWVKAIPSINEKMPNFISLKRRVASEVKEMPNKMSYYPEFMAKRMNFPVGYKDEEVTSWDNILATNQDIPDLDGMECIGGVDYATTDDFVGVVLLFRVEQKVYVKQHTFVCTASRDLPGIKAPLKEWEEKGHLTFVDDVEISPDIVAEWFDEQVSKHNYQIKKICIDYFRRSLMIRALKNIGFDAKENKNLCFVRPNDIGQVVAVINSLFVNQNLVYGDVPVLRWMTNNVKKFNSGNNILYGKQEEHYRKTDTFMAIAAAMTQIEELEEYSGEIEFLEPIVL